MNRKIKISLLSAILAAGIVYAQQESQSMAGAVDFGAGEVAAIDTTALYNNAIAENEALRSLQMADNIDKSVLFPKAYDVADAAMSVLHIVEPNSQRYYAMKEILRTLAPTLEDGVFHYSNTGDRENMAKMARKFIDIRIDPAFKTETIPYDSGVYHILAYNAASDAYNRKEYDKAIDYFKVYFSTGDKSQRETVYTFMGQAAINTQNYDLAIETLTEGVKQFPANEHMRNLAIQACAEGNKGERLEQLVDDGLALFPENTKYLDVKGRLMEDNLDFLGAAEIFNKLDALDPNKFGTTKHIALCYYNAAVNLFNQAQTVCKDEKEAAKMRRKARNYFAAAAQKLEEITTADPTNANYLRSLGVAYLCMEQKDLAQTVNNKLQALGQGSLGNVFMPPLMSYENGAHKNFRYGGSAVSAQVPLFSEYGNTYVTDGMKQWIPKGEFETIEAYQKRISDENVKKKYDELKSKAQEEYIQKYSSQLRLSDIKLEPYDVRSQSFKVETNYGPFYVKVPNKDNEAELFKANWAGAQFLNTTFCVMDDKVQIASLSVLTPTGKKYDYNNERLVDYQLPELTVDVADLISFVNGDQTSGGSAQNAQAEVITGMSDVDKDIPENKAESSNKLVLIFANEQYDNVAKVESAYHDGKRFSDYCVKTLGIPRENVSFAPNASLGKMRSEMHRLEQTVAAFGEPVDVIVYYAGHGMPDDATKNSYLLPVDGDPLLPSATGLSLDAFYKQLSEMNARSVSVFLDACFSGARRDGKMLNQARAVVIQPKEAAPKGNMFILSAASGQETALPYRGKHHGMFTYYLLKKLQESKGNATLKDIADYVISNVSKQSTLINKKQQTPTVQVSGAMQDSYKSKKLRGK